MRALAKAFGDAFSGALYPPRILEDEPMRNHTTFRVGGPADILIEPTDHGQIIQITRMCAEAGSPLTVMGMGSNLLARDGGIRGTVLRVGPGMSRCDIDGDTLCAQAGMPLASAAYMAAREGLDGLAFAEGIPGSIGGAACMNAGAYEGEMSQIVQSVDIIDESGALRTLDAALLAFSYRHSAMLENRWVVTKIRCKLRRADPEMIAGKMRELSELRRSKQPVDMPSAGSTFKRSEGRAAAMLIENAGLKGARIGGALVSRLHAGFICNAGGATARDILALIELVKKRVYEHSGVKLSLEVRIVGVDA